MRPPYAIGSVPRLSGHAIAYRWRSLPRVRRHRASKPQGSSERVLLWQITMDQLIFASLSHTHYWYEVGMLKVPVFLVRTELRCLLFEIVVPPGTQSIQSRPYRLKAPKTPARGLRGQGLKGRFLNSTERRLSRCVRVEVHKGARRLKVLRLGMPCVARI